MFHEYNWSTRNKEIKGLGLDKFARGGEKKNLWTKYRSIRYQRLILRNRWNPTNFCAMLRD